MALILDIMDDDGEVELVPLALPLDRETISWLARLSKDDVEAAEVVASMLRAIREDDEINHRVLN